MKHFFRRGLGWLVSALAVLLTVVVAAQASVQGSQGAGPGGSGSLEGAVVMGTAGGPSLGAGLTVTLRVLQGDVEVDSLQAGTDAGGRFRFVGLDEDPALAYWPEVEYQGLVYRASAPYTLGGEGSPPSAMVTVYESTADDSAIELNSVHLIVESFGQVLRVSEIQLFGNAGDRTFVGREAEEEGGLSATLYIPLPDSAVGIAFQPGTPAGRFVEVDGGLMDSEPVLPGQETSLVFFSYHLMGAEDTISLERRFAYPLTALDVLVAQPGLTLRSAELEARGVETFQGQPYEIHAIEDLPADTPVGMELSPAEGSSDASSGQGLDSGEVGMMGSAARGEQGTLRSLGFVLVALTAVAAVAYALLTGRPAAGSRAVSARVRLIEDPEKRGLLAELADLEDAFEAGQIDEVAYRQQRAERYGSLRSLWQ